MDAFDRSPDMTPQAGAPPSLASIAAVPAVRVAFDPQQEDAHWSRHWQHEPYARGHLDYEDYAPAYCVGYVGFAQYGGSYRDAEAWLCSNWLRLKGDSRLELDEARPAMQSAWERVATLAAQGIALRAAPTERTRDLPVPCRARAAEPRDARGFGAG